MSKILNTRIQSKYDLYANWMLNPVVLLKGEIAIAEIPAATGAVAAEPAIMFKVGDGVKTFAQLPFASGIAADVYEWAKATNKPNYTAAEIEGLGTAAVAAASDFEVAGAAEAVQTALTAVIEANAATAAEAVATEKARAEEVEADFEERIATLEEGESIGAVAAQVNTLIGTDANKSVRAIANEELAAQLIPESAGEALDTLQEIAAWIQAHPADASAMNAEITALKAKVGESSVVDQIDAAIEDLDLANTYEAKGAAAEVKAEIEAELHEHENKTVLDGVTAAKVATWDVAQENVIESIRVNGVTVEVANKEVDIEVVTNIDELEQDDGTYVILNCGSSTVNV